MPVAAAIVGAGALGAGATIWSANRAADAQTRASQQATQAQMQMYNRTQETLARELGPYAAAGRSVLPTLAGLITPGADQSALLASTPGFQFASDWGQRGLRNQATMRGLGGNVLTAGADYNRNMALHQSWLPTVNALQQYAGMGAGAAGAFGGNATNAGIQTGAQIGSNMIGAGNAQAGAAMAQGNAINNFANTVGNYGMFSGMYGGQSPFGTGAPNPYTGGWNTSFGTGGINR